MKINEKNLKIIGGMLVAGAIAIAFLYQQGFIGRKNGGTLVEKNTVTYRNEYFSIEYPKTMTLQTVADDEEKKGVTFSLRGPTQIEGTELYDGLSLTIRMIPFGEKETFEEFVEREADAVKNVGTITEPIREVIIARRNGIVFTEDSLGVFRRIFVPWRGGRSLEAIEIAYTAPDPGNAGYEGIVASMLESLMFKDEVADTIDVRIFFSNELISGRNAPCEAVVPVTRTVNRKAPLVLTALQELLKGPTDDEKKNGYITSLNNGVDIINLIIKGGEARIDFNESLNQGVAGSCRVTAIRAQIEQTVQQFAHIETATISVRGKTEGILEP